MKPIIGILAEVNDDKDTKVLYPYVNSIETAGGIPIVLPYTKSEETIDKYIELCDGMVFTGGVDIEPSRYGEVPHEACGKPELFRDDIEFNVFEKLSSTDKPILAICRGAQLINCALGGTLWQDIPSEIPSDIAHRQTEERFSPSHGVKITDETPLRSLVGRERMAANSFHHQAIRVLGKGLRIMAVADDGIIEAFYSTGKQYIRAYQWHPERLFLKDADNLAIFKDFIDAAKSCAL
jgi:putative glutamine amidotransferase